MSATPEPLKITIDDQRFAPLASGKKQRFQDIGKQHGCQVTTELNASTKKLTTPVTCSNQENCSSAPSATFVDVRKGDLAEQSVDMIVVSTTSDYLRNDIVQKAGSSVSDAYNARCRDSSAGVETGNGTLPCRTILLFPCKIDSTDSANRRKCINAFVHGAIEHGIKEHYTSVAFPAVTCGGLKWDPALVAEEMLLEIQKYASDRLHMFVIILRNRVDLYDAFCAKVIQLRKASSDVDRPAFSYPSSTISVTISGKSSQDQEKCNEAIERYVQEHVLTKDCDEFPLYQWNQTTIDAFYTFCLDRHVFPEMDPESETLRLSGPREHVINVLTEFYRVKAEKQEENYIALIARHVVWGFLTTSNTYEKYSLKINARIEDAYQAQKPAVHFQSPQGKKYQIKFDCTKEICEQQQRQLIRHDFPTPTHWVLQSEDVRFFPLDSQGDEHKKVLDHFNATVQGNYNSISKVERIQNHRWHTAYLCQKKFMQPNDGEQWLFHGCPKTAAGLIKYSCFNRSFAGQHGTAYGRGVYFSKNASFSHGYASVIPGSGVHHMFYAKVPVGKSTLGNTGMNVPPAGSDSTTDNNHIYVTYHDDQAYAEYLITYI